MVDVHRHLRSLALLIFVLATYFSASQARHHKIRHARHKKMVDNDQYAPVNYVVLDDQSDVGPWSEWSAPSSCSRSCGGGVASQSRQCEKGHRCAGPDKRYFSCNIMDCPDGTPDLRVEQCAKYNEQPFEGIFYDWIPYTKGANKCELNCMPKGERFFNRHAKKVIDGTRCDDESPDVCVDGVCMPVGCDLLLGSDLREDKCRECGGDGTGCNTVKNKLSFDNDLAAAQYGYNDIFLIPAGATNIMVRELNPANNYLAVRNENNTYYLNGNFNINYPREFKFAGTTFHYERQPKSFFGSEVIRALGPTNESLYIVLLYQEKGEGIEYEYSFSKETVQQGDPDSYSWVTHEFSACSAPCGGGTQNRTLGCVKKNDNTTSVTLRLCDPATRPQQSQSCNEDPCDPEWFEGPWGNCSRPCKGGTQHRSVHCQQIISNARPSIIEDDVCLKQFGDKPSDTQSCNYEDICPLWHTGPWSACSKLCGKGKQSREVVCYKKIDGKVEVIDDNRCGDEKPEYERDCINQPCDGVDWMTSEWTRCEDKCGLTKMTRTVVCASAKGKVYPDESCTSMKPAALDDCENSTSVACEHQWYTSQWSQCSSDCGKGVRTRAVFCASMEDYTLTIVEEDKCEAALKFTSEEECESMEKCAGDWYTGPWSDCSEKCGGEQTRLVTCFVNGTAGDPSSCESSALSQSSQSCELTDECMKGEDELITEKDITESPEEEEEDDEDCIEEEDDTPIDVSASIFVDEDYDYESEPCDCIGEENCECDPTTEGSGISSTESMVKLGSTEYSSETASEMDTTEGTDYSTETGETEDSSESSTLSYSGSTDSSESAKTSDTTESGESSGMPDSSESGKSSDMTEKSMITPAGETVSSTVQDTSSSAAATTKAETTTHKEEATTEKMDVQPVTTASSDDYIDANANNEAAPGNLIGDVIDVTEGSGVGAEGSESTKGMSTIGEGTSDEGLMSTWSTEQEGSGMSTVPELMISDGPYSTTGDWDVTSVSDVFSTMGPDGMITPTSKSIKFCKKRKSDCSTSKFGCCNDGFSAAKGPFKKGCEHPKTCKETKHGCCPDGVSQAHGPYLRGCKMPDCNESLYGCCKDNKTAASGNDFEGCEDGLPCDKTKFGCCDDGSTKAITEDKRNCVPCEKTKYGCCADGKRPAFDEKKKKGCRVNCLKTEFGCCPNNKTVAKGPDFEGCGVINKKNCSASYFKCCPDGTSPALGPNFKGCKSACQLDMFGCCPDGLTPAHGPNKEGCCMKSTYGCCPDNILAAGGPSLQGCECSNSNFGCCPNGVDYAKGPNKEGCGCKYTEHGCCPDGFSEANGPDFAGCSCETFQFGCCPDGVTITKGPANAGCGCKESEFGCCQDNQTRASGPDFEGCGCDVSQFGCCPDGVHSAQGERFEECEDAPKFSGEACGLERDRGNGRNFTIKWFFDNEYGGCSRFWYGGSEGNNNRFETQEECKRSCVEPPGRDACSLPKIAGPCEGYNVNWFYNTEERRCAQFVYGGCLGNNNKFQTLEECRQLCAHQDIRDKCAQPKLEGPCYGNFERWHFDSKEGMCKPFKYGGCKGNQNNFMSERACNQQCQTEIAHRDVCKGDDPAENCGGDQTLARWKFDSSSNRCLPFYTKGCDSNARNSFKSEQQCSGTCPAIREEEVCRLPPVAGECRSYSGRWYYNVLQQRCLQFYYGGCGGNANNFATEEDCSRQCKQEEEPEVQHKPEFCMLQVEKGPCTRSTQRWFYDSREGYCKQFQYGGCEGNHNRYKTRQECEQKCGHVQDPCRLPKVAESCSHTAAQFYYDHSTDSCHPVNTGECLLNTNRFPNMEYCEQRCRRGPPAPTQAPVVPEETGRTEDRCNVHPTAGDCHDQIEAWYFDVRRNACNRFLYSGCGGNGNRFSSEAECSSACVQDREFCKLSADRGGCEESFQRFYFDIVSGDCKPFVYTGCGGNRNHFEDAGTCIYYCGSYASAHENEIPQPKEPEPTTPAPVQVPEEDKCSRTRAECEYYQRNCQYGVEQYVGDNECSRCRCSEPCKDTICPENTKCIVEELRAYDGSRQFRAMCRPTDKPGVCPPAEEGANCDHSCREDADCSGGDKCCFNGCAYECRNPNAVDRPVEHITRPPPTQAVPEHIPPSGQYEAPQIQLPEPLVRVSEGSECTLRCHTRGYPRPVLTWTKDRVIDGSHGRHRLLPDGSLQIIGVTKEDGGVYNCRADNGIGSPAIREIRLDVTDPVTTAVELVTVEPYVRVHLNTPAVLHCYAMGWPRPSVTWFKAERLLPMASKTYEQRRDFTLLIASVTLESLGPYTCQAYNGLDKAKSWTITVQGYKEPGSVYSQDAAYYQYLVEPEPVRPPVVRPPFRPPPQQPRPEPPVQVRVPVRASISADRTSYAIDTNMRLKCNVDGYPIPQVTWFKDDQPIESSRRIHISENHELTVERIEAADAGTYRCDARNQDDRADNSVVISVDSSQQIHPNCTDSPLFANCKLIVSGKYCTHKYYARFCCRSCTEAGQLPLYGPHLQGYVSSRAQPYANN